MDASIEAIVDHLEEIEAEVAAECEQQQELSNASEPYATPLFDCGC
jgi:hypothetical protein